MPHLRYKSQLNQRESQYLRNPMIGNLDYADTVGASQAEVLTMKRSIRSLWWKTQGQDLVEYALAAGMVAVAAVASMPPLSATMSNVFKAISGIIQNSVQ